MAAAQEAGTPEAAGKIYAVTLAAQAEQERIRADASLTAQQKAIELKRLELEQLQANTLATGGELLPEPQPEPAPPPPRKVYVLGPGDSAETIALMYGLPPSAIRAANPNVNFSRLKPGTAITIPRSPLSPYSTVVNAIRGQHPLRLCRAALLRPDLIAGCEDLTQRVQRVQRFAEGSSSLRFSALRRVPSVAAPPRCVSAV